MNPRTLILGCIAAAVFSGCAQLGAAPGASRAATSYELKDGSTLTINADGRMRMFDVYGRPLYMSDGVPMVLKDGSVVVMKEDILWKTLRIRGTLNPRA